MLCFHERHVPPCYQSQLIIMLCFIRKGHVPPCYQSQLIIMLCFHERHVPPKVSITTVFIHQARPSVLHNHHVVFSRKGHVLRASITTHHHVVLTKGTSLRAINHNSSSCCVLKGTSLRAINHNSSSCATKGARPSVLSITTHHHVVLRKARPPCYQSQLIIMLGLRKGHVLRAINHNSSSCATKGTSSVLSITTSLG
jgi:hypothetical protein